MLRVLRAAGRTRPPFPSDLNTGPWVIPAASSQACKAATGHDTAPRGIGTTRPAPSWSVFERRSLIRRPSLTSSRSFTVSPASSERRKAPAKPTRRSARSRNPRRWERPAPWQAIVRRSQGPSSTVPCLTVRRMPLTTALTCSGRASPSARCASRMAATRRERVAGLIPSLAWTRGTPRPSPGERGLPRARVGHTKPQKPPCLSGRLCESRGPSLGRDRSLSPPSPRGTPRGAHRCLGPLPEAGS